MGTHPDAHDLDEWLASFERAVSSRDFEAGRGLFFDEVVAYGTRATAMFGLDSLLTEQWTPIWTATKAFHFTAVDHQALLGGAWVVAARWASDSLSGQRRTGRCTLVLTGTPLRCVHSHFSMTPLDGGRL